MFLSFFNKFILTFNFYYDTFHTTEVVDMKTSYLAKFTKVLLDVMLVCGILCTLSLPWLFRFAGEWYPNLRMHYTAHVILFMFSGAGAVLILRELRCMFKTVLDDNCFVKQNIISLRRMGFYGLGISVVTALRLFIVFTPATLLIIIVFFIAALFSFVLGEVFDRAANYKQENDLTI